MKKARDKIVMLVLVLVLSICILGGCTAPTNNDDKAFISWMSADLDHNMLTVNSMSDAMDSESWYTLEALATAGETYIDSNSKIACNSYTVSSKYIPLQNEYSRYLIDVSWIMFYAKWYAKEMQSGSYSSAIESANDMSAYIDKAQGHLEIINEFINE